MVLVPSWAPRVFAEVVAFTLQLQRHGCFLSIERFNWQLRRTFITIFVAIDGFITVVVAATAVIGAVVAAAIIEACLD